MDKCSLVHCQFLRFEFHQLGHWAISERVCLEVFQIDNDSKEYYSSIGFIKLINKGLVNMAIIGSGGTPHETSPYGNEIYNIISEDIGTTVISLTASGQVQQNSLGGTRQDLNTVRHMLQGFPKQSFQPSGIGTKFRGGAEIEKMLKGEQNIANSMFNEFVELRLGKDLQTLPANEAATMIFYALRKSSLEFAISYCHRSTNRNLSFIDGNDTRQIGATSSSVRTVVLTWIDPHNSPEKILESLESQPNLVVLYGVIPKDPSFPFWADLSLWMDKRVSQGQPKPFYIRFNLLPPGQGLRQKEAVKPSMESYLRHELVDFWSLFNRPA